MLEGDKFHTWRFHVDAFCLVADEFNDGWFSWFQRNADIEGIVSKSCRRWKQTDVRDLINRVTHHSYFNASTVCKDFMNVSSISNLLFTTQLYDTSVKRLHQ